MMPLAQGKTSMTKSRRLNNKREMLLDAAERVAVRLGAANLTLETVAREAKVGKGGLIYHFPSKKALFQAMLNRAVDLYTQSVQSAMADPSSRDDFARAHIRSLTSSGKRLEQLSTIIISVAVNYPDLLRPLRKRVMQRYEEMMGQEKTGSPAFAGILAVNGLFLMECLGVGPLQKKSRTRFIDELYALIQKGVR